MFGSIYLQHIPVVTSVQLEFTLENKGGEEEENSGIHQFTCSLCVYNHM